MSKFDKETKRDKFFVQRDKELNNLIDPRTNKLYQYLVEEVSCPLCDSRSYNLLFSKNGSDFVRCQDCSLVYVNPRIKKDEVIKYYKINDLSNRYAANFIATERQKEFNDSLYRNYFFKKIKEKISQGKILDIGCGTGQFLSIARELGYDVMGLELNEKCIEIAEKSYNIKVEKKLLHECNFEDESFDVVSMIGVVEHLTNPVPVMKDAARVLKPGGLLIGVCPNVQSLVCAVLHEHARTFTGRNHLSYFSKKTLNCLCRKAGLKNIEIDTFVSGKDSLLNYFQFIDPFGDEEYNFLPEKFKEFILDNKNFKKIEENMNKLGLGYKLRFFTEK